MGNNILIVDDDEIILRELSELLKNDGHKVDTASSGEKALKMIGKGRYDIVFTDLKMPGMDGMELLKNIKSKIPGLDVVMITGFGTVDTAVEAMKMGAKDYIPKPFKMAVVKNIIKDLNSEKKTRSTIKPIEVVEEAGKFDSIAVFKELTKGKPGLWITTAKPHDMPKDNKVTYLHIGPQEDDRTIHPKNIYKLKEYVKEYVDKNKDCAIMLDCLDLLIATHTGDTILKFMGMLEELAINGNIRMLVTIRKEMLGNETIKDIRYIISSSYIQVMADSLSNPLRRRIVRLLKKVPSSFSTILANLPNTESAKLSFHLQKLITDGIIDKDDQKRYYLTERGNKALSLMESMEFEGASDDKNLITLSVDK